MNKRNIIFIGVLCLVTAAVWVGYSKMSGQQPKVKSQKSDLSQGILLFSLRDSSLFRIPNAKQILLVYFNSDCHYCQKEFSELEEAQDRFAGVEVIFFSFEPIARIEDFVNRYEFVGRENFHFTKINLSHQAEVFGPLTAPSFFFYKNEKLVGELKGKKTIPEILDHLQ